MDHRPVYRDPRTGNLKFANFANPRTVYWGTLEWDSDLDQWTLRRKRRSDGRYDAVRSGRGAPERTSDAQLILDRMNRMRNRARK